MLPFIDLIVCLCLFVLGLVSAIPIFITGTKAKADITILLGAVCIALSMVCFILLARYDFS